MNDDDWWWKMNMTNELDDVDVMRIYDWLMLLRRLHANKLLHFTQGTFTHKKNTERSPYTEEFLHRNFYTEISVQGKRLYTDRMTHTHKNFWKHLHKKHFLQENFYIQKFLHRKKNAQNNFYTQMDETWLPLPPWEKFGKIQVDHLEINSCEIKSCVRTPV